MGGYYFHRFWCCYRVSLFSVVIDCSWTWTRERFAWVNASSPPIKYPGARIRHGD